MTRPRTSPLYLFDATNTDTRWGYASAVAIIVLIVVSVVGSFAIRPIERAQEETLSELTGGDALETASRRGSRTTSRARSRRRCGSDGCH